MMAHSHSHSHSHGGADHGREFALGVGLNVVFVIVEAVFGLIAGSLALLADAGHNLSDVLGLLLAWGASILARRKPTIRRTYGLRRSSILAALLNAMLLLVAVGGICWEAIRRLITPEPPPGSAVIWVAAFGVVINTATALLFMRGREHDLNIRGAYLHMAADAGISLGVVFAGIAMQITQWVWLDPGISLVIVVVILFGTWSLLRESLDLVLDAVPRGINPEMVRAYLSSLPEVQAVHDLHIWALSTTETALTVHLVVSDPLLDDALLMQIRRELHDRFEIEHPTVQIERGTACQSGCDILG
jgi:cobalt-zinc-cadmium efflux system protein